MRAVHVRAAVESVRQIFNNRATVTATQPVILASRWREEPLASSAATPTLRWAWALVSMRIVGRSVGSLSAGASLRDGETWFLGEIRAPSLLSDVITEFTDREAVHALESFTYDDNLRDLLPYVLDANGPGSRASVMKDPNTQTSRRAKRATGVFYTPSDVAEYIVRETLGEFGQATDSPRVLDPACGSGVFLKAVLDSAIARTPSLNRSDFVERCLHGIDINPLAVEATCFVLLHECLHSNHRRHIVSPWSLWHRIRCNLCVADALTFLVAKPTHGSCAALTGLRQRLNDSYVPPATERFDTQATTRPFSESHSLGSVFPAISSGADIVIGNPPYARIGPRDDLAALERRFVSLSAGTKAQADYFPLFVEMMWQFARPRRSSSGMVVPLSLACSRRSQLSAVRRAIADSGGQWRFAFFDREPHALFGEDVKTRNTIVLRRDHFDSTSATTIDTGPLRKWTSRQRNQFFDTIDFTPISDNGISITTGIPKLDGPEAVRVFGQLARRTSHLREMCSAVGSCLPEHVAHSHSLARVFVAGTAYNFLNVFRPHRKLPAQVAPWSMSTVLALKFANEDEAARCFALLSSRVSYWLWRVNEDGFHVTQSFLMGLPFNDRIFNETNRAILTRLGSRLWEHVQAQQVISINGGRQTVAYRPNASENIRNRIDALLIDALDVDPSFIEYLHVFTRTVVTVEGEGCLRYAAASGE